MDNSMLPDYVNHLLLPDSYPHQVGSVELVQTHISFVFLAGDYVYKWKKPVDFGFVDFSSLAKRKFFCEQELVLNRRLCPDIYLNTVRLCRDGQSFRLNGDGEIVEYGLLMARMPEARMMTRVIEAGGLGREHLARIVDILVPFYQRADKGEEVRQNGKVSAVARNIMNNFAQTERFVGTPPLSSRQYARIRQCAGAFLQREELFAERVGGGWIRDCHGDLYSGNICLADDTNIHIFDCIEFNNDLRFIDIAADVAFLAMDLDYHGLPALSDYFITRFIERSGDAGLPKVLDFYKCYRAYVRGKVSLLAAVDPAMGKGAARTSLHTAGRYFQLAEEYAEKL